FLVGDRQHQRWSMGAGCLVNWTATYDATIAFNFAADCFGDVFRSDVFNVHANLSSERNEPGCGVEIVVEVGVGVGVGIGIEITLGRESAGEAAEIVEPPVRWPGLLPPDDVAWPATPSVG